MNLMYVIFWMISINSIDSSGFIKSQISQFSNKTVVVSRKSRTVSFPSASTVGLIVAIATPFDLPNREIVFSYNFEANYNSPNDENFSSLYLEDLKKYGLSRSQGEGAGIETQTKKSAKHKAKKHKKKSKSKKTSRIRRFLDRNIVFKAIESKMISMGFSKTCLLRAICDVALSEYGYNNGVLGDIFHIIFTPSSSHDDGIDLEYYKAEYNGNSGDCSSYVKGCPKNILDFITVER